MYQVNINGQVLLIQDQQLTITVSDTNGNEIDTLQINASESPKVNMTQTNIRGNINTNGGMMNFGTIKR